MEYTLEGHGYNLGRVISFHGPRREVPGERFPPPELLASLHVRAPSSPRAAQALPVATSVKEVLDLLRPKLDIAITHCSFDEHAPDGGHLVIGAYFPTLTAEIARDDTVAAGVIVGLFDETGRGGGARLLVHTRIFRKVCENGAMIHVSDEPAVELDAGLFGAGRHRLTEEIERRIVATQDPALFTAAVAAFRAAAADPLDHRGGSHGTDLRHALTYDTWQAVMAQYASEPWTRWSLANAVTVQAHAALTFTEMARLERIGGQIARTPGRLYDGLPPGLLDPAAAAAVPAEDDEKISAA